MTGVVGYPYVFSCSGFGCCYCLFIAKPVKLDISSVKIDFCYKIMAYKQVLFFENNGFV